MTFHLFKGWSVQDVELRPRDLGVTFGLLSNLSNPFRYRQQSPFKYRQYQNESTTVNRCGYLADKISGLHNHLS
jgi:hypothetical protein